MSPNSCFPHSCFPLSWFETLYAARTSAGLSPSVVELWGSSWFISPILFITFRIVFATIYFLLGGHGFPWVAVWTVLSRLGRQGPENRQKRHRQWGKVIPVESVPGPPTWKTWVCGGGGGAFVGAFFRFFIFYGLKNRLPLDPLQPAQSKHSLSFSGVAFQQNVFCTYILTESWKLLDNIFYILLPCDKLVFFWKRKEQGGANRREIAPWRHLKESKSGWFTLILRRFNSANA